MCLVHVHALVRLCVCACVCVEEEREKKGEGEGRKILLYSVHALYVADGWLRETETKRERASTGKKEMNRVCEQSY